MSVMKSFKLSFPVVQFLLLLMTSTMLLATQQSTDESTEYICPPCGHNCLETVYTGPGACGECGMQYIKLADYRANQAAQSSAQRERKTVAILIFENVQINDYTGPWEVFGGAGFEVFTVAKTADAIATVYDMQVTPHYAINDHPPADILLVPGGGVIETQNDPAIQKWIREQAATAEIVLSVCNGAFILAKSGILKGLKAITTRPLVDGLASAGEDITIVKDVRYVDNGKVITSGGLSAGIDAALHVVERIHGKTYADRLAYGLEYHWEESERSE